MTRCEFVSNYPPADARPGAAAAWRATEVAIRVRHRATRSPDVTLLSAMQASALTRWTRSRSTGCTYHLRRSQPGVAVQLDAHCQTGPVAVEPEVRQRLRRQAPSHCPRRLALRQGRLALPLLLQAPNLMVSVSDCRGCKGWRTSMVRITDDPAARNMAVPPLASSGVPRPRLSTSPAAGLQSGSSA